MSSGREGVGVVGVKVAASAPWLVGSRAVGGASPRAGRSRSVLINIRGLAAAEQRAARRSPTREVTDGRRPRRHGDAYSRRRHEEPRGWRAGLYGNICRVSRLPLSEVFPSSGALLWPASGSTEGRFSWGGGVAFLGGLRTKPEAEKRARAPHNKTTTGGWVGLDYFRRARAVLVISGHFCLMCRPFTPREAPQRPGPGPGPPTSRTAGHRPAQDPQLSGASQPSAAEGPHHAQTAGRERRGAGPKAGLG